MRNDPDKLFYEHCATDDNGAQFHVDLCEVCHDAVLSGLSVQATDVPHEHEIHDTFDRAYGYDCHACGNWTVEL